MSAPQTHDLDALLSHADWLRRLAARLVRGDEAADAVQETFLAALRSPPASDRPAKPWLATVLRNAIRRGARTQARRRAREEAAASAAEAPANAAALLERMQLQRLLAELVTALDEPFRTTLLLRHYEGLQPTEIATRLGVPAGTVRWRLNEGAARLRTQLAARLGESNWRPALIALAPGGTAATAPTTAPLSKGATSMSTTPVTVGLATVITLAGLGLGLTALRASDGERPARVAAAGDETANSKREAIAPAPPASATTTLDETKTHPAPARPSRKVPRLAATATPEPPPAQLRGGVDKEEIRQSVRAAMPAFKDCFERDMKSLPPSGYVTLRFALVERAGVGHIDSASIVPQDKDDPRPELNAPLTEQCLLEALSSAPWKAPVGGVALVTYPLFFSASGEEK